MTHNTSEVSAASPAPVTTLSRRLVLFCAVLAAGPGFGQTPKPVVRVEMLTGEGRIVLELIADKAPITTANFLRYVDRGLYDGATLYRAMKSPGPPPTTGLIQGGAKPYPGKQIPPIAHESTTQTGLTHTDGVIALARRAPGTAASDFFICVGDQLYLDADPKAAGDNLGFAAFGKVVEGMEIVRKIIAMPTSAKAEVPEMVGQMLDPPVKIIAVRRIP